MNEHAPAPRVAIVGAGPSGCYLAQFLRKRWADAAIEIIDRHDAPNGLIRYGVAPDHLGTKAIAKQFERLFARDGVVFTGNTRVGTDISLEQLRVNFDVVVLATGLWGDRVIDGFHAPDGSPALRGVYGSGAVTRLINGHPDEDAEKLRIGRRTVIIGNGNVAVDLVRIMLTPPDALAALGIDPAVVSALTSGPLEHIDVVGRSAAHEAKFDVAMIRELAKLSDVRFTADAGDVADLEGEAASKAGAILELAANPDAAASRTVAFHFGWTPDRAIGTDVVERVVFRPTDGIGAALELDTDSVCTAVGFTEAADAALRRDAVASATADLERGQLADGLYCVGWFRRGPVGTIPANRADARMVADTIIADVEASESTTTPLMKENR